MTALVLATARQLPKDSDFTVVALFSVVGLALSLVLLHFDINPGDLG
jgi:hypothetical protein